MILQEEFPRATVFWILIAQCTVFLVHLSSVPLWLTALYFSCLIWRVGIYQGRWSYPNKWLKGLLIVTAFVAVFFSYHSITGAKGGVALLLLAFAYKSLEMKQKRDAYLVVVLAYFIVACGFLFQRSLLIASYLIVCTILITAALISMNSLARKTIDLQGLWLSIKILLQAIPLMVFLFIFFPQLPPLFQVNLGNETAKTGLSDSMSPGSISDLIQSGELVFRASFEDKLPLQEQLYWRAQIFEEFDGITWTMSKKEVGEVSRAMIFSDELEAGSNENNQRVIINDNYLSYEILQEASDQKLLFSLATAWSEGHDIKLNTDFTLTKDTVVKQLYAYQLKSNLAYQRDVLLDDVSRYINLSLSVYGNERSKELAKQLRANHSDDMAFFEAVKHYFTSRPFEYTLKPPILGKDPVDEFVFDIQKGFCEHYASSFVYIMRAGGVPARVVGGYMGGEYNANGNYYLIHQFDAHAWAEIWIQGEGWLRVDPTAWIAPERINQGIQESLPDGESILSDNLLSAHIYNPLTQIRLQLDYLNMSWDKWVLGYDEAKQAELMRKIMGEVTPSRIALFMFVCFGFVLLCTVLAVYIKEFFRVKDKADRVYVAMQSKLKKRQMIRQIHESPSEFCERAAQELPTSADKIREFTELYNRIKYKKAWSDKERKSLLKDLSRACSMI